MKYQEIITNSKFDPKQIGKPTSDIDEIASRVRTFINQNCKPWLKKSGGRIVYRGMAHESPTAFTRAVRSRRKPKDSSPTLHKMMNMMIQQVGGVANRSNSAFVTANYGEASAYGNAYIAIPVGEFRYTWSPEWQDWQVAFDEDYAMEDVIDLKKIRQKLTPQQWAVKYQQYKNDPDSFHHIFANSKSEFVEDTVQVMYYRMLRDSSPQTISQYIDPRKVKQFIVADKRLHEAIDSKHEIMIHCEKMLYIDEDFLQQVSEEYYDNWIKAK